MTTTPPPDDEELAELEQAVLLGNAEFELGYYED